MILVSTFLQNIELDNQIWGMDRFTKQADGSARIEQPHWPVQLRPSTGRLYLNRLEVLQDRTYKQKFGGFWRYVFDCICLLPPLKRHLKSTDFLWVKLRNQLGMITLGPSWRKIVNPWLFMWLKGLTSCNNFQQLIVLSVSFLNAEPNTWICLYNAFFLLSSGKSPQRIPSFFSFSDRRPLNFRTIGRALNWQGHARGVEFFCVYWGCVGTVGWMGGWCIGDVWKLGPLIVDAI